MKMEQSVSKRRHIKFRGRRITQKKIYNIQNKTKVWNQEKIVIKRNRIIREDLVNCSHFSCLPFLFARITLDLASPLVDLIGQSLCFSVINLSHSHNTLSDGYDGSKIFFWTVSLYLQGCTVSYSNTSTVILVLCFLCYIKNRQPFVWQMVLQIAPREVSSSTLSFTFEDSNDTRMTNVKHKVYSYVKWKTTDVVFHVSSVH